MDDGYYDSFESSGESGQEENEFEMKETAPAISLPPSNTGGNHVDGEGSSARGLNIPPTDSALSVPKLSSSPAASPKVRKRFMSNFRKPQGLGNIGNIGNITQKIKKRKKKVFGVSLQTAVYRSQLGTDGIELPTVFRECIDYLEENALEHEGLYRLAGVKSHIEGVKALYDKGVVVDLNDYDRNVVASLLKLYLRELPEPLIPSKANPKFEEAAKMGSSEMCTAILRLLVDELPACNRLLLGWLLEHMSHVAEKSHINRMGIMNLIIVFSPTLQISIPVMNMLFRHHSSLFHDCEIKRYYRPQDETNVYDLPDPESLETEEEVTAELERLSNLLEKLHTKVHSSDGQYDERDEYCWDLQRVVTDLRRRKKMLEKISAGKAGDEYEFKKTLMVMEATLQVENEELKKNNVRIKEDIRKEVQLIEQYDAKVKKSLRGPRSVSPSVASHEEETELSQQIRLLSWKRRELEKVYFSLLEEVKKEEQTILQLKIKLKVLPFEQSLANE